MNLEFSSLYELLTAIPDEAAAVAVFKGIRWKTREFCPYCGHEKVYGFSDGKTWKCADCRQRFSIRVGTIFEDSKIPLRKWLAAIWIITSHRKGISSAQLARDLEITQKSAWFMLHRLRHAARTRSFNRQLRGEVEVDEAFIGGKEKNKHAGKRVPRGRGKAVVFGMLERGGELRARPIPGTANAKDEILENVAQSSHLMTDEWSGYRLVDKHYIRQSVRHSAGEYVRKAVVHVNGIEGFWSLLKRQIYGIHHWVSAKHLRRYVDEAVWRYNRRAVEDENRVGEFLTRVDGRLTYRALIAKA